MSDFNFRRYYFEKLTQDEYSKCLKDMGFYIEENISKLLYKLTNQNFAITRAYFHRHQHILVYQQKLERMKLNF